MELRPSEESTSSEHSFVHFYMKVPETVLNLSESLKPGVTGPEIP